MSNDEIIAQLGKNTCGIFTSDQLPGQVRLVYKKRLKFLFLSLLSMLGFSVAPLKAQSSKDSLITIVNKAPQQDTLKPAETTLKKSHNKYKRTRFFRRRYRVLGCVDF